MGHSTFLHLLQAAALTVFLFDCLFKNVYVVSSLGRERESLPPEQREICLLSIIIKITAPSRVNVGQVCVKPIKKISIP